MKTIQQTVMIGENMGAIPGDYDFMAWWHESDGGLYPNNPEIVMQKGVQILQIQDLFIKNANVWILEYWDGPRRKVIDVGMYDGWPYWKPVPNIQIMPILPGSGTWISWLSIHSFGIEEKR